MGKVGKGTVLDLLTTSYTLFSQCYAVSRHVTNLSLSVQINPVGMVEILHMNVLPVVRSFSNQKVCRS